MAQDNKINFFFFFFTSLLCKTLMMFLLRKHCKEGASVVIHFWVPTKNKKIKKIYQKIFRRNPRNNRSEKRMLECRKNTKIV
jgi:hypothetical protein